jgi:hypothetical protein
MASGDILAAWTMLGNDPPAANAALPTRIAVTGSRNRFALQFASTGSPEASLEGPLINYDGGGVTVRIHGAMDGANTGTKVVRMEAAFERMVGAKVLTADDFAAAQVAESTVDNTSNARFTASVNFSNGSQMGSVANKEWFRLRFARINSGLAGDNASGVFNVIEVDIVEQ